MSISTSPLAVRLALALLLPLYMLTTTGFEHFAVRSMWAWISGALMMLTHRTPDFSLHQRIFATFGGGYMARYFVTRALHGPWLQLLLTYIFSWDALWLLFPDKGLEHWAHVTQLRRTN
jgi:hypothetical protein